ncbi:hypothetical protein VNO80_06672 [Phaseolus coccineus]|uniref:Uncharacterized protein n=1 Tax=Phaseolus coccineus TaxID=3886 RepID=A0AAN9NI62_PHACN
MLVSRRRFALLQYNSNSFKSIVSRGGGFTKEFCKISLPRRYSLRLIKCAIRFAILCLLGGGRVKLEETRSRKAWEGVKEIEGSYD